MPRKNKPTRAALERNPQAVIILGSPSEQPGLIVPGNFDFEWFIGDDGARQEYLAELCEWCKKDVEKNDDTVFTVASVEDTATMKIDKIEIFAPKKALLATPQWIKERKQEILANPMLLVVDEDAKKKKKAATPSKAPGKGKVKAKTPSAAADAVVGPVPQGAEPKVKAKDLKVKVRQSRTVHQPAPPDEIPENLRGVTGEVPGPEVKADAKAEVPKTEGSEALRKRLAAKKEEAKKDEAPAAPPTPQKKPDKQPAQAGG